jgi:eukaryotic-like serine/threonine-protein kinase
MSPEPTADDLRQPTRQDRQTAETLSLGDIVADTGNPTTPAPPQKDATAAATAVTALHPTTLIGRTYDDLEFQEELGRGGMGIVFKARQKSLNRTVAVKLLLAEHYVDPVRLARFHAEARAAANLDHPNIVQVFQVGQCAVGHYFVMEYVNGQSLEAIAKSGKVSKSYAVSVLSVVAEAVHYAHTKGIVHRDLKPANILMDKSNRPVVMDFGIVKFVGKSSSLTQQGAIIGTPAFMAPEQAGETTEQVGPQSDVYSLGAILYMLLTGRAPYAPF